MAVYSVNGKKNARVTSPVMPGGVLVPLTAYLCSDDIYLTNGKTITAALREIAPLRAVKIKNSTDDDYYWDLGNGEFFFPPEDHDYSQDPVTKAELQNYAKTSYVNENFVSNQTAVSFAKTSDIDRTYARKADVASTYETKNDAAMHATKQELNEHIAAADETFATKAELTENYHTKQQVHDLIEQIALDPSSGTILDMTEYAKKTYVVNKINNSGPSITIDVDGFTNFQNTTTDSD